MNNDTNQPQNNSSAQGLGLPPILSVPTPPSPEPAAPPAPVTTTTTTKIEPLTEVPSGLPPIEIKTEVTATPPVEKKPKKKVNKKLAIGGALVALLVVGVVALAAQLGVFTGEQRSRAAGYCGSITCPDGTQFGEDQNSPFENCGDREAQACQGHQQAPGGGGGGGGTPTGCAGPSSHSYCKDKCDPGNCPAPDGTRGACTITTDNNCRWNPESTCSPGSCDNAGGGVWKKCNSSGTAYESTDYTSSSCSAAPTYTCPGGTGNCVYETSGCSGRGLTVASTASDACPPGGQCCGGPANRTCDGKDPGTIRCTSNTIQVCDGGTGTWGSDSPCGSGKVCNAAGTACVDACSAPDVCDISRDCGGTSLGQRNCGAGMICCHTSGTGGGAGTVTTCPTGSGMVVCRGQAVDSVQYNAEDGKYYRCNYPPGGPDCGGVEVSAPGADSCGSGYTCQSRTSTVCADAGGIPKSCTNSGGSSFNCCYPSTAPRGGCAEGLNCSTQQTCEGINPGHVFSKCPNNTVNYCCPAEPYTSLAATCGGTCTGTSTSGGLKCEGGKWRNKNCPTTDNSSCICPTATTKCGDIANAVACGYTPGCVVYPPTSTGKCMDKTAVPTTTTTTGGAGTGAGSTPYVPPTTSSTTPPVVVAPNPSCNGASGPNPNYHYDVATAKCTTPGVCTQYGDCCGDGKSHTVQVTCLSDGREQYDIVSTCNASYGTMNCGEPKPGDVPGCPAGSFWWSVSVGGDDKCHDISQQPNPGGGVGVCGGGKCTPQDDWCFKGFKCNPDELMTYTGFCNKNMFDGVSGMDYQQVANSECKTIQLDVWKRACSLVDFSNISIGPDGGSQIVSPNVGCTPTTTTPPPGGGTPAPGAAACVNTRIFINGSSTAATAAQMNALKIGDKIKMVVMGNDASIVGARFDVKINGQLGNRSFPVTTNLTPIRSDGVKEFYYEYQINDAGAYTIEGYVNTVPPAVTATPLPTATATVTSFPTATPGTGVCPSGYACAPSASGLSCAPGYHSANTTTPAGACSSLQECFSCLADTVVPPPPLPTVNLTDNFESGLAGWTVTGGTADTTFDDATHLNVLRVRYEPGQFIQIKKNVVAENTSFDIDMYDDVTRDYGMGWFIVGADGKYMGIQVQNPGGNYQINTNGALIDTGVARSTGYHRLSIAINGSDNSVLGVDGVTKSVPAFVARTATVQIEYPSWGKPATLSYWDNFRAYPLTSARISEQPSVAGVSKDRSPLDILKDTLLNTYRRLINR